MAFEVTEGISARSNFVRAQFKIAKVAESFQSTSNDLMKAFSSTPALVDNTLCEALNIVISGPAYDK